MTFGLMLARKVTIPRALAYMIAQCLGAICGAGLVKGFQRSFYETHGGGANSVAPGYSIGTGLAAEIIGTFVLVYTVFSATDPKRNARDSHVPVSVAVRDTEFTGASSTRVCKFLCFLLHLARISCPFQSLRYSKLFKWGD